MKTIYLDMDGVVADFDAYAEQFLKTRSADGRWSREHWNQLREHKRMYRDLPKTPEADELVDAVRKLCNERNYNLLFLTAVPKGNDFHWAFYDKMIWVQQYYPDIAVHFGPYSVDKQVHCNPGDVLIDDRLSNIQEWELAGGIAIRHQGDLANTLQKLSEIV